MIAINIVFVTVFNFLWQPGQEAMRQTALSPPAEAGKGRAARYAIENDLNRCMSACGLTLAKVASVMGVQKLIRAVPSTLRGAPGMLSSADVPWPETM